MTLEIKEVREYANELVAQHSARNKMDDGIEAIFQMDWAEKETIKRTQPNVKVTLAPDPRNKTMGALRLLIATEPQFAVEQEDNPLGIEAVGSKLERWAKDVWNRSSRLRKHRLSDDVVLSLLLFDEVHIGITKTADMVNYAGKNQAARIKAEQIARKTPFVYDVYDPRTGYPDFGEYGLDAFYREVETTRGKIEDQYGEAALNAAGGRYSKVTICHFWDNQLYTCWLKGQEKPIKYEEHGLPFIPFVVQTGAVGTSLFKKAESKRQPFLFTIWKSEMWNRQNLALTTMFTHIFAIGANPLLVEQLGPDGETSTPDWSRPGGVWHVPYGNSVAPMTNKGVIDPSLMTGLDIAERKTDESTIYDQALGEPVGGNAPYAMVSLLQQAGRLPLIIPQRTGGQAISDASTMALLWFRQEGAEYEYTGGIGELESKEIPEYFEMTVSLDVSLPQDQLQSANLASVITSGEDPLVSKNWARENVLHIGQPDTEQSAIWDEIAAGLEFRKFVLDQLAQIKAKEQEVMTPTPPPGQMPPGQQMPPEQEEQPGAEQPPPQGIPPEMMQGSAPPLAPPPGMPPGMNPNVPPGME